ncbi:MAG: hypothetical protein ACKVU4_04630 [Phycisphaerales bacterium]
MLGGLTMIVGPPGSELAVGWRGRTGSGVAAGGCFVGWRVGLTFGGGWRGGVGFTGCGVTSGARGSAPLVGWTGGGVARTGSRVSDPRTGLTGAGGAAVGFTGAGFTGSARAGTFADGLTGSRRTGAAAGLDGPIRTGGGAPFGGCDGDLDGFARAGGIGRGSREGGAPADFAPGLGDDVITRAGGVRRSGCGADRTIGPARDGAAGRALGDDRGGVAVGRALGDDRAGGVTAGRDSRRTGCADFA